MREITITVKMPEEIHRAAVARLEALQARQAHLLGGEPAPKDKFGMSEYVSSCIRADLITHQRQQETEARIRAAKQNGEAARVSA